MVTSPPKELSNVSEMRLVPSTQLLHKDLLLHPPPILLLLLLLSLPLPRADPVALRRPLVLNPQPMWMMMAGVMMLPPSQEPN